MFKLFSFPYIVKTVLSTTQKEDRKLFFKTDYRLINAGQK